MKYPICENKLTLVLPRSPQISHSYGFVRFHILSSSSVHLPRARSFLTSFMLISMYRRVLSARDDVPGRFAVEVDVAVRLGGLIAGFEGGGDGAI